MRVECSHCGTALTLIVADWTPDIYAERSKQEYACPACQKRQAVTLSGHVVQVTSRAVSSQVGRGSRARTRSHRPVARTTEPGGE